MILHQDRELLDDSYLDAINSLLVSGEYPPLFSEDETNSLLQVIQQSIYDLLCSSYLGESVYPTGYCPIA